MTAQERIEHAKTRITKLVFPQDTNPIGTLYGGTAMKWMDEVAFLAATRFARRQVVTVSMDRVDFKVPIPEGSIVELIGEVIRGATRASPRACRSCVRIRCPAGRSWRSKANWFWWLLILT